MKSDYIHYCRMYLKSVLIFNILQKKENIGIDLGDIQFKPEERSVTIWIQDGHGVTFINHGFLIEKVLTLFNSTMERLFDKSDLKPTEEFLRVINFYKYPEEEEDLNDLIKKVVIKYRGD